MNIGTMIKRIQDIMRQDAGVNCLDVISKAI